MECRGPEFIRCEATRAAGLSENPDLEIALGLVLVGLTLYTSTLSYALRTYSRSRLAELIDEARRRDWLARLDRFEAELQSLSSSVRVFFVVALALWCYVWLLPFGASTAIHAADAVAPSLLAFALLLLFAIGIPNALALHAGERVLRASLGLLWTLRFALYPLEKTLVFIEFVVRRLLGKGEPTLEEESDRIEQEVLEVVSEGQLQGALDGEQKEMIESVLELHDTAVSEIMTPRTDIVALAADADFEQTRGVVVQAGHSRVPVFEGSLDRIVGVLYAKDLIRLNSGDEFNVRTIMRSVPYVPEAKTIDHLLREFRQERVHIAIVLDEYGGTAGLVTIEDILEELVGEIDDEYDQSTPPAINRVDADTLEVDARVHVHEINEALDVSIPDEESYETIGGFLFSAMGKIPASGDEFRHENIKFSVVDAEPRKINRLRIHVERVSMSA